MPIEKEVKQVVFSLNADSASEPDKFSRQFYQSAGKLLKKTLRTWLKHFYGYELPRYLTHTNLVLIPKKKVVTNFGDLRPISLNIFSNKIISRIINDRIIKVLPRLISSYQADFV